MNKEVQLTISGLHNDGQAEGAALEAVSMAEYYKRNDNHYLVYEETMEGFDKPTKNRIKFKDNLLELTRQGLLATHMIFEENKTHMTPYATPYGEVYLGITTDKVQIQEQKDSITVLVEYRLETEEALVSECRLKLHIENRLEQE